MADPQRLVRRVANGYRLSLGPEERVLLRAIAERLEAAISIGGTDVVRLYPPAFPTDADAEASYREAVQDELVGIRERRIAIFRATIEAERLTPDQAEAWLGTLNDARLVLGTALEVDDGDEEDPASWDLEGPDGFERLCFLYAGALVAHLVDAIASSLPDPPA